MWIAVCIHIRMGINAALIAAVGGTAVAAVGIRESVELVSYELEDVRINEGPAVIAHNGKYYLTFSVGRYSDNSYQVAQAVADSVMGPYRKLTAAEGAILMSGEAAGSQEVSGTGHHAFIGSATTTLCGSMWMPASIPLLWAST